MKKLTMFVWNNHQITPVTCYGEARAKGNYEIIVSDNPPKDRDAVNADGGNAIVYHFANQGSGVNGR